MFTNTSDQPCTFVAGREKDGSPKTVTLQPGESGALQGVDTESGYFKGKVLAGVIEPAKAAAAKRAE